MGKAKRVLAALLALVLILAELPYGMEVKAAGEYLTEGDYEYIVNADGDSVEITNYIGDGGDVTIPSEIDGKKVTSIGSEAFSECSSLTSISILSGVTSIGGWAFSECNSLESISIPSSVTSIGDSAFLGCSSLASISIPSGVTSIGGSVFSGCSSLASISIPSNVMSIGDSAFAGCSSLASISIPSGVTRIGHFAFYKCSSLASISIPSSVTSIEYSAFSYCSSLESIEVDESNTTYDSRENCNAIIETGNNGIIFGCKATVIPRSVTYIWGGAFEGCSSLESISIPSSVTVIGGNAFKGCSSLASISIPNSVTSIGDGAFGGCSSLASIEVDESNTRYDSRENCNAIIETESNTLISGCKATEIPSSVTSIGDLAFDDCSSLASISIPSSVTSIGDGAFGGCSSLASISIPSSVTSIRDWAFDGCSSLASISIPSSVTSIGDGAFGGCSSLASISIPSSVTSIGDLAFEGCSSLVSISIPNSVTSIGGRVFSGCSSLESISIPSGVTSIGERAFYDCSSLESISIPNSVTSIGDGAFGGCSSLTSISIPSSVTSIEELVFLGCSKNLVIYGYSGSTAKTYADQNGFKFVAVDIVTEDISQATVTLDKTGYTYDGTAKTPSVTVILAGKSLILNTDYTVTYSNNTNVGTAKVAITGKGDYTGTKFVNFTIVKAAENLDSTITCKKTIYEVAYGAKPFKINAASGSKLTFTSSNSKIAFIDKNTGKVTIKGTGFAVITIKSDSDLVKVTVKVTPKKPSLKSVKVSKGKKLTVKWAKDKNASGYQVQVSTSKNFKKNRKQKNVTKTSYTFTKLKAGQKYYVRVRSYKKSGKEMLYSVWSSKKQGGKVKK